MNLKNILTALSALCEGANTFFVFVPWHGVFLSAGVFVRACIDAFWPAQSNVETPK